MEEYELIHEKAFIHGEANRINSTTSKPSTDIDPLQKCPCECGKGIG